MDRVAHCFPLSQLFLSLFKGGEGKRLPVQPCSLLSACLFFSPLSLFLWWQEISVSSAYLWVEKQLCLPVFFSLVWGTAYPVSIQPLVCVEALVSTCILLALLLCPIFLSRPLRTTLSLPHCYNTNREQAINLAARLLRVLYILPNGSSATCWLVGGGVWLPSPLSCYHPRIPSSLRVCCSVYSPLWQN